MLRISQLRNYNLRNISNKFKYKCYNFTRYLALVILYWRIFSKGVTLSIKVNNIYIMMLINSSFFITCSIISIVIQLISYQKYKGVIIALLIIWPFISIFGNIIRILFLVQFLKFSSINEKTISGRFSIENKSSEIMAIRLIILVTP